MRRKRGYSKEFPTGILPRRRADVDWVPPGLLVKARAKARREGISLRVAILRWMTDWVKPS